MGNRLSFEETDMEEYEAYQREMVAAVGPARVLRGRGGDNSVESDLRQSNAIVPWSSISFTESTESLLGSGTFSNVYRGTAEVEGSESVVSRIDVAVKILKNQHPTERERELFQREIRVASLATHPSLLRIVSYSDSGYWNVSR
jgi:hypothetical protein